jgi:NhaP-type Na+/H+ or K+/H+ antiporter
MVALLVFAATLLVAVFLSELARRSVLSTAVLFLFAGFIAGTGALEWIPLEASNPVVQQFSTLALFSILFTDGMRTGVGEIVSAWHLPGRALLLGLPLTLLLIALLAHWIVALPWIESFLLGAALSPTDPVFAAAIVGREEIPQRIRHLLNVESGVNDGMALPLVLILLALAAGSQVNGVMLFSEVVLGIGLGIVIPWLALRFERTRFFSVAVRYEPFDAFAIGLLVFAIASLTHANEFLAAFFAGLTIASTHPKIRDQFHEFGERLTELLKLGAILLFGALMSPQFLGEIPWSGYLFAALVLLVVRPIALSLALFGSPLSWREWVIAAWFGPRGFASVVFGLIVLQSGIPNADKIFHLIAIVVVISIIAHSSTDVVLGRWLYGQQPEDAGTTSQEARG